jgi:hypothetical protein
VFYALWLLEIDGKSGKNSAQGHASKHLTRARKTQKRLCENTMTMLTAAETCLIQFVIRRSRSFENSQIPITKSLSPTGLT